MNRKAFRLVYSRLKGMLVAVEESATATGKGNGETAATRRTQARPVWQPAARSVVRAAAPPP
ncbi:MAG TPA: ESPR-type extended signal peptide-containing protein [Paraburkholderia sp.]|nr:ESPR-type extended signal peptide-containing protein [Paraburkholderia sp.]